MAPLVGRPEPLGAHLDRGSGAVNFSLLSSSACSVTLCLFTENDLQQGRVTSEIILDPINNRTGDIWHVLLANLPPGLLYGYRVQGKHQLVDTLSQGHRHDESRVLLDPYAHAIISRRSYGHLGADLLYPHREPGSPPLQPGGTLGIARTWPQAAASVPCLSSESSFDWEGDRPLNLPMEQLIIYEMHVRGFTQDQSSGVASPGTYKGMVERLDYLQKLGVNAVELLPMQEFNELEYYSKIPGSDAFRVNFWGYSTVGFFAPMSRYSDAAAKGKSGEAICNEFKTLVKECHQRGIEVILDVVFNHTAEGNEMGPTLSFRGLDNRMYYMLAPEGEYYNYSGCGNTLNTNHPNVRQFIVDCLKYWVLEYHVDGFRFDLASILTRAHSAWHPEQAVVDPSLDPIPSSPPPPSPMESHETVSSVDSESAFEPEEVILTGAFVDPQTGIMSDGAGNPTGTPLSSPPLIDMISQDPILRNTKLIAEAWDCDGLNQVGAFPHFGGRWSEWNGKFRDVVRNFIKGTDGPWAGDFAAALCGSPNIYSNNTPHPSDWWANNGGRQWKGNRSPTASVNFVTAHDGFTLNDLVSYNEKHNEANGEDNRDGETHNLSWNCGEEGSSSKWDVKRLRQRQIRNLATALLVSHGVPMLTMGDEYGHSKHGNNNTYCHDSSLNWLNWAQAQEDASGLLRYVRGMIHIRKTHPELQRTQYVNDRDIQWHGLKPNEPDWSDTSRLVAFSLEDYRGGGLFVAFNTSHEPKVLSLPRRAGRVWQQLVDSSKLAPFDLLLADEILSETEIKEARAVTAMWAAEHAYPLLPWSCIILESRAEDETALQRAPHSRIP